MQVDILFYPREARRYHETVPFEINGLSTMNVEVFGEGTDMKVGLLTLTASGNHLIPRYNVTPKSSINGDGNERNDCQR